MAPVASAAARLLALALSLSTGACGGSQGADAGDASVEAEAGPPVGCAPDGAEYALESTYESGDCAVPGGDAGAASTLSLRRMGDAGERATVEATGADSFVCEGELAGCAFRATCTFGTAPNRSSLELSLDFAGASLTGSALLQRTGAQPCSARYRMRGTRR